MQKKTKKNLCLAICGTFVDSVFLLLFMALFLLLFKKSTAQFTYCFISAILFAFCLIRTLFLCFHPEYLEKYHVIPKKKKTMEQLNAMLFVIQRQPYVIANYSKEMADIAESFAKKESSISGNDIAELYDDLMDGLFDKVPSLINKMTTVTTERVSRHGIYS